MTPVASPKSLINDFSHYAPRYLKVKKREGGMMVPLILKPIQSQIDAVVSEAHAAHRPALIQINKSRRLGSSTYVAGRFSHRCYTRPYQRAIVMAHRGPDAKIIFQIYERMWEHLPPQIRPKKSGGKGSQLALVNLHSQIDVGSAESTTFGRGGDAQLIHLSEAAYYPDPEELLSAILPGVSAVGDGILVLESTANGPGTWWHELWQRSEDGTSRFTPLFFAWYEDPEHRLAEPVPEEEWTDEEREGARTALEDKEIVIDGHQIAWLRWRQDVDCQGRDDRRRREYPWTIKDSFCSVGQVAWEPDQIIGSSQGPGVYQRMPPLFRGTLTDVGLTKDPAGALLVWEEPQNGCDYVIGADPAGGIRDGDLCAAEVYRVGKQAGSWPVQVAEWAGHEDPVVFAKTLTLLGTYYRKALLAVEVTGVGKGCQAALQKVYYYPRLHRWIRWDQYKARGDTWGWETTPTSKDVMVGLADWLIRGKHVTLHSPHLVHELLSYQEVSPGEYECVTTDGHGDRLMASFIAWASWFQHVYAGVPLKDLRSTLAKLYGGAGPGEARGPAAEEPPEPQEPRGDYMRAFTGRRRRETDGDW